MPAILSVFVNGKKVLVHEKTRQPGQQRKFLDGMDIDMDEGIELNGTLFDSPDKMQRAHYVAMSLLYGIEKENEGMISATSSYLANRLPELTQIRAFENDKEISLELIYNEPN